MGSNTFSLSKQFVLAFSLVATLLPTQGIAKEFLVNTLNDAIDINVDDELCGTVSGTCSLRAAIQQANALAGADSIILPAGTYILSVGIPGDDEGVRGDLDITDEVSITGNTADDTIIDGNNRDRVLHIHAGASATLANLTIQNGNAASNGGGINNYANAFLELSNVTMTTNKATNEGGGLFNEGIAVISNTSFTNNSATSFAGEGGAIANDRTGFLIMHDSSVSGNISGTVTPNTASTGGGIYNRSHDFYLTNVDISGNIAGWGAGIYSTGTAFLHDLTITGNHASFGGGTSLALTGESSLQHITITGNLAQTGGGIYIDPDTSSNVPLLIDQVNISNNQATGFNGGGGVYVKNGVVNLKRSLVSANSAKKGGGLLNVNGEILLADVTISGNTAETSGGGIEQNGDGNIEMRSVTVAENIADIEDEGDNIHNDSGELTMRNTIIAGGMPNCYTNFSATTTTLQFNIATDTTCKLEDRLNDLIIEPTVPLLEPLADNGGLFYSHALANGSPAIDSGFTALCSKTDQRLFYRGDGSCDIGAFELNSIATNPGMVEFEITEVYEVEEDSASGLSEVIIPVKRTDGNEGAITLRYSTTFGTASSSDYSLNKGELKWNDGDSSSKNIIIEIRPDEEYEPAETISVMLFSPGGSAVLGNNNKADIRIFDNDFNPGQFRFEQGVSGLESSTSIKVAVIREEGLGSDGEVSVSYATQNGQAIGDEDFVYTEGILEFAHGEMKKEFHIDLIDDQVWEGNEEFTIVLSNPQVVSAPYGGEESAVPTIHNLHGIVYATVRENDPKQPGTIQFVESSYTMNEDDGTAVIELERIGGSDDDIIVQVSTTGSGTATPDTDYTKLSAAEVSFAHGETKQTLVISIKNDDIAEDDETIGIRIINANNDAKIGEQATTTITVIDDNDPLPQGSSDQGSGDQSSGDQSSGDQSSGDQGSGDQGTGDQSTGDQGTGEQNSGDQGSANDNPTANPSSNTGDENSDAQAQQQSTKSGSSKKGSMDWFLCAVLLLLMGYRCRNYTNRCTETQLL